MKTVKISEFKAKCIEQLKTVEVTGEPLVVTLRNRPIVTVHPYRTAECKRKLGALKGRMTIHGDIVNFGNEDEWEMNA